MIVYQLVSGQEKQLTSFSSDFGYGPGWRGGWYGGAWDRHRRLPRRQPFIRARQRSICTTPRRSSWCGEGLSSKTLDPKAKPEKQQKNMAKAAEKLMKKFPPPKG